MKLGRLNHVGVATPSIEQSLELYRTMLGGRVIVKKDRDCVVTGQPTEDADAACRC